MPDITPDMAGCWLDGSMGWHNNYRVIDIAITHGWVPDDGFPVVSRIRDAYEDDVDYINDIHEGRIDIAGAMTDQGGYTDQATDYLNSVAPEGFYFEWDGDLILREDEDYDPEGYDCDEMGHLPENAGKCVMCGKKLRCSWFTKACIYVYVGAMNALQDLYDWSEENKRRVAELKAELKASKDDKSDPS